jgi:tetratricopeptide (TPR) repeat protein
MKTLIATVVLLLTVSLPCLAASPKAEAAFQFAVAQTLAQEGSYRQALKAFEDVVLLIPDEPYVRLEFAEFLARLSRWHDAAEQADIALQLAPDNVSVLRLVGRIELNRSESDAAAMDRARQAFERVIELEPEDRETVLSLGQIYLSLGRASDAADLFAGLNERGAGDRTAISFLIEALQRSNREAELEDFLVSYLEHDSEFLKVRLLLSRLQSDRGDHQAAATTLGNVSGEDGESLDIQRQLALELYRSGDSERALEVVDSILEGSPDEPQVRYLQAMILMDLLRLPEAEAVVAKLADEQPENLQFHLALSQLRERQGRSGEAAAGLAKAAVILEERGHPRQAETARLELAGVGVRAGDWQTVVVATRQLLDSDNELGAEARLLRGEALHRLDRTDEALAVLAEIDRDSPLGARAAAKQAEILFSESREAEAEVQISALTKDGDQESLLLAAEVYQRAERHGEAIPVLLRARKGLPDSLQVLFWLGAAYERTGQLPKAEDEFRRLLSLDPEFAPALNYLGYMWTEQGQNLQEALELVNRAVELEPDNGAYLDSLGWAYYQLGRYGEARDNLERAAELIPDDAVIVEHLGDLHQAVGELDEAREYYLRAVDLDGDNLEEVRRKLQDLDGSL